MNPIPLCKVCIAAMEKVQEPKTHIKQLALLSQLIKENEKWKLWKTSSLPQLCGAKTQP